MTGIKDIISGSYSSNGALLMMALAVIAERIRALPEGDKNDLFELTKVLATADTQEEIDCAAEAMREILDQEPISTKRMEPVINPGEPLKKWMGYVGGRIKAAREAAGLTQEALAAEAGLPQSHICRLERGQHSPSYITLEKIAKALKIPVGQLDPSAE